MSERQCLNHNKPWGTCNIFDQRECRNDGPIEIPEWDDTSSLKGEPMLDPAYAVEMSERERRELMQADDWSHCLERFFLMEGPVDRIRSYES